jgi:D-alanyl-D-alanine dipeptidase
MNYSERQIPLGMEEPPLDGIPIKECGDSVVVVPRANRIHIAPAYHSRGVASAPEEVRLRVRVLERLRCAAATLPTGCDLLIWDGLRSLRTQQEIVEQFQEQLRDDQKRDEEVALYLAFPPASEDAFLRKPPPHSTGGAVDLTLCDEAGCPLDLGADFDQFDQAAWVDYYETDRSGGRSRADLDVIRRNRRILFWSMLDAGFAPYPLEYWHYEIGTTLAAAWYGLPYAEYGAAVPWTPPS